MYMYIDIYIYIFVKGNEIFLDPSKALARWPFRFTAKVSDADSQGSSAVSSGGVGHASKPKHKAKKKTTNGGKATPLGWERSRMGISGNVLVRLRRCQGPLFWSPATSFRFHEGLEDVRGDGSLQNGKTTAGPKLSRSGIPRMRPNTFQDCTLQC